MEEQNTEGRVFTEKEVMDIISKMQREINAVNNTITRLNYLFKVIENREAFSAEFIQDCVEEVENILSIKNNQEE